LRWIAQDGDSKNLHVRHLKEGMSRVEPIPLQLPIPELASHPRMTRAEVVVANIDLLQLSAAVRVLEIEAKVEPEAKSAEEIEEDASPD
jgi:exoribonuclease-2